MAQLETSSLEQLPSEILMEIFCFCSFADMWSIRLVSNNFRTIIGPPNTQQETDSALQDDQQNPTSTSSSLARTFSLKYYLETRKSMEKLISPPVIYRDDSDSIAHAKTRSLLFDWKYLDSGLNPIHLLDGFLELERDLQYISQVEFDWKYFGELTEKLNSVTIIREDPKIWHGFYVLDKRGERIPIFCRSCREYEESEMMNFIVLGLFDSNDNLTGNLHETNTIKEAIFFFQCLGSDSQSRFTGFDWMKEHFTNYIRDEDGLAFFGSALEFYITSLQKPKVSRKNIFGLPNNRVEYYFCERIGFMNCFNSLYSAAIGWYGSTCLNNNLSVFGVQVELFYSHHKKKLMERQQ